MWMLTIFACAPGLAQFQGPTVIPEAPPAYPDGEDAPPVGGSGGSQPPEEAPTEEGSPPGTYPYGGLDYEPGMRFCSEGYTRIEGDLNIGDGYTDAEEEVPPVHAYLVALRDLDCLEEVTGNVLIWAQMLEDLEGLGALERVGGTMYLQAPALRSLGGLESLSELGGLRVRNSPALTELSVLGALQGGDVEVRGPLPAMGPDPFAALRLAGQITLSELEGPFTFPVLEEVENLDLGLWATGCDTAPALRRAGRLSIQGAGAGSCAPVSSLQESGDFSISVEGLDLLTLPDGLVAVDTLSVTVDGPTTIAGLSALTEVRGDFVVENASRLRALPAFPALATVDGSLVLRRVADLGELGGFPSLTRVGGDLELNGNYGLSDLDAFSAVEDVGGDLRIERLALIRDTDGLGALRRVGGDLLIGSTSKLQDLDGLYGVQSVGGDLRIQYNSELPSSVAIELAEALAPGVAGIIFVAGNADG